MTTSGLLLAAGAGRRMGRPKALVPHWLPHAVETLAACDEVVVVLGAEAERARPLLDPFAVTVVVAHDWAAGMGSSLAAGLGHLTHGESTRCLVTLVDLPDIGADVVDRLLSQPDRPDVLARASYHDRPGHPVLLGREHWAGVLAVSSGDRGARDYLRAHPPVEVECGDLATGRDIDAPDQLDPPGDV